MATNQRTVYGATVEWGTDGTTYANIPECKGLAVPTVQTEYLDATHLQSPGGFREYVPGLKDAGVLEIPCGYSTAGYNTAKGYEDSQDLIYFRTTMPLEGSQTTGDIFTFTGYVTAMLNQDDIAAIASMTISIRTSGSPTFTQGS